MKDAAGKVWFEQLCKLTKALLTIPCIIESVDSISRDERDFH